MFYFVFKPGTWFLIVYVEHCVVLKHHIGIYFMATPYQPTQALLFLALRYFHAGLLFAGILD